MVELVTAAVFYVIKSRCASNLYNTIRAYYRVDATYRINALCLYMSKSILWILAPNW